MRLIYFIALFFCFQSLESQSQVKLTKGEVPLSNEFYPEKLTQLNNVIVKVNEHYPLPSGIDNHVKEQVTAMKEQLKHNKVPPLSHKRAALNPQVINGFMGASNNGTPNDNNMAVNNDSFVISVLNTNIRVYKTHGEFMKNWSLEFFPRDLNNVKPGSGVAVLDRSYDPKVVFDPVSNRFIIVYLEGSESSDTRIIVAFSKTSNPLQGWNVYQINGNPIGGKLWTDYPIIGINGVDLFITVNILKDNTDWRDGFTQSIIWQMPCERGYNADTLKYNLWSNITYNNKPIWSICAVQDAFLSSNGRGMYFLSVRPGDVSNDSVFLHRISENYNNGNAQYSLKVLKSNLQYGLPPWANQPINGFRLQTNDARVLSAFFSDNKIQFVQTSRNAINGRSSVYHGLIQSPDNNNPTVSAKMISYDSLELAYPSIACAGNNVFGRQSLITFSHVGPNTLPGTSVIYFDNNSNYSELIRARAGDGYINSFISDSFERWGDYTSIQKKYNAQNEYWLVGSYGRSNNTVGTWISKINTTDPSVKIEKIENNQFETLAYPNPVSDVLNISFKNQTNGLLVIKIFNSLGQQMDVVTQELGAGEHKALINLSTYQNGIYTYSIQLNQVEISNGKFSKQ
jgi:hypothetical protein